MFQDTAISCLPSHDWNILNQSLLWKGDEFIELRGALGKIVTNFRAPFYWLVACSIVQWILCGGLSIKNPSLGWILIGNLKWNLCGRVEGTLLVSFCHCVFDINVKVVIRFWWIWKTIDYCLGIWLWNKGKIHCDTSEIIHWTTLKNKLNTLLEVHFRTSNICSIA